MILDTKKFCTLGVGIQTLPGEPVQEQSQAPALGGKESLDSLRALEGLVSLARSRGARIMLLMTWGYKEGDPAHHKAIFPDYNAMQARRSLQRVSERPSPV